MAYRRRKNYWKLFSILVIIGLIVFAVFRLFDSFAKKETARDIPKEEPKTAQPETKTITAADVSIKEDTKTFSINAKYPAFSGLPKDIQTIANQAIKSQVDILVKEFKINSEPESGVIATDTSTLDISYDKTIINANATITAILHISQFYSGAAHPDTYDMPITISKTTGKKLAVKDFFKEGSEYLKILSQKAEPKLQAKLGNDFFTDGAGATIENYNAVYPTDTDIVILFNPAQVAPRVNGVVKIAIPRAEVQDILK